MNRTRNRTRHHGPRGYAHAQRGVPPWRHCPTVRDLAGPWPRRQVRFLCVSAESVLILDAYPVIHAGSRMEGVGHAHLAPVGFEPRAASGNVLPIVRLCYVVGVFPPTTERLRDPDAIPYFAWDLGLTVSQLERVLASSDEKERDEVIVRLLREANSRDVWLFVSWDDIEAAWPRIMHRLGRARGVWELMRRRRQHHVRAAHSR